MSATSARRLAVGAFILFSLLYVAGSLLVMRAQSTQITRERQRLLNIADQLEILKGVLRRTDAHFVPERELSGRAPQRIVRSEQAASGERRVALHYDAPSASRRAFLDKYHSDLVLRQIFYLVTTSDGRFVDVDWDKP